MDLPIENVKSCHKCCLLLYTYILTHVIKVINSFPIFHQYVVWGYLYSPIHNIPYCLRAVRKRSLYFPSFPNFDKGPSVRVIIPTLKAMLCKQDTFCWVSYSYLHLFLRAIVSLQLYPPLSPAPSARISSSSGVAPPVISDLSISRYNTVKQ